MLKWLPGISLADGVCNAVKCSHILNKMLHEDPSSDWLESLHLMNMHGPSHASLV